MKQFEDDHYSAHIVYLDSLINDVIADIEEISKVEFVEPDPLEVDQESSEKSKYHPEYFIKVSLNQKLPSFLNKIVAAGSKRKVLQYLEEKEVQVNSRLNKYPHGFWKIPLAGSSTITWIDFKDLFWKDPEKDYSRKDVEGEIIRCYLKWVEGVFNSLLYIEQKELSGNENSKKDNLLYNSLTEEGKKLVPFLKKNYAEASPQKIAIMLFALHIGEFLKVNLLDLIQTELHLALTKWFPKVGTRQSLNNNITLLSEADSVKRSSIEQERKKMVKELTRIISKE